VRTRPYAALFENISAATNAIETVVGYGDAAPYVLPLGDSITEGQGNDAPTLVPGGYRQKLYTLALANGVVTRFVGPLTINPAVSMVYPNHAGISGNGLQGITDAVNGVHSTPANNIAATPVPKIVLINAGNNDVKNGVLVPALLTNFNTNYDALIAAVATKWTSAQIVCMTLGPFSDTAYANYAYMNALAVAPNTKILSMGTSGTYAARIAVVDTASIIPVTQTGDGLHWADAGYQTMAEAIFYNALTRIF
jgi:lysophospholipase L1-like esterase